MGEGANGQSSMRNYDQLKYRVSHCDIASLGTDSRKGHETSNGSGEMPFISVMVTMRPARKNAGKLTQYRGFVDNYACISFGAMSVQVLPRDRHRDFQKSNPM